jgi:hypothetical protein
LGPSRAAAAGVVVLALLAGAGRAAAQTSGGLAGRITDARTETPLAGARVVVLNAQRESVSDTAGLYRIRDVRAGWHRVRVLRIGYRPVGHDSVLVRAGEVTTLDVALTPARGLDTLAAIDITAPQDVVLDPLATETRQRITAEDLRQLPVSSLEEALALSAGAVGESYRGGRLGQQSFILDGLGVKNQLDASTGGLGIRIPPDMLTEAGLVTNGFSARYGQALSGMVNVVTRDGADRFVGRVAYETDRPAPAGWDYGLDRLSLFAEGPLPAGLRFVLAADASGRLDAEPVNAPPPPEALDPRHQRPNLLPHNAGETYDLAAKLRVPVGARHTLRLFGLLSEEQRLLFDPALKYDDRWAPARRVSGRLLSGHWQYAAGVGAERALLADLRVATFEREFLRGQLREEPRARFGAFTFDRFAFEGEAVARAQDTLAAAQPLPGYVAPDLSSRSPWGVPAFFLSGGGRGGLAWNRFAETRVQLDVTFGGRQGDVVVGGEVVRQRVETFQRVLPALPVGDSVPRATASEFRPLGAAAYGEAQLRWDDLGFTFGLRYDRFDPRTTLGGRQTRARTAISPRFAVSTVLRGATFVASWGRFAQAPDFQYLVDAAFDDTTRTGRFRAGNPALGFENATQYEFSLRARPRELIALRLNGFVRRLEGLVASVPLGLDPDSSIFGNADFGTVKGIELLFEREFTGGWGVRVVYALQKAEATATNAFQLFRRIRIAPGGVDTIVPARVEFPLDYDRRHGLTVIGQARVPDGFGPRVLGLEVLGGLEAAAIARWNSGLPYSRTNAAGDTLLGLPNSARVPGQVTVDVILRRPVRWAGLRGGLYLDVRNLLNRRNIVAVRRDSGEPGLGEAGIEAAAQAAYQAHPEPIPYESPRYRPWADLDGNGLIAGAGELLPLYRAAARDFHQPLFSFGPPRLIRFGVEVIF